MNNQEKWMKVDRDIRTIGPLCLINNYSLRIVLTWIRINRIYEYLGYSRKREQWDQDLSSERIGRSVDLILKLFFFSISEDIPWRLFPTKFNFNYVQIEQDRSCFEIEIVLPFSFFIFGLNHSADSKLNRSIENRIDLRCNHGLLTGDVGVRVEMWLQLDVSHSDVRGYTPGVHTRRFSLVCLLESACNLDLSYNRFQWCKCTDWTGLFMHASICRKRLFSKQSNRFHD